MKILLLGDYSNVHATLADGLRRLGHQVAVASDGDGWKDYPRDIDLHRPSLKPLPSILWWMRMRKAFHTFRGYDVVQLINPVFLPMKAERIMPYYHFLRRHNRKIFMGAFGMDHYFVKASTDCSTFRYGDFNLGDQLRETSDNDIWIRDWLHGRKGKLNQEIARDCDGIIAGLYEYYVSYQKEFADKLTFIPFPIRSTPDGTASLDTPCAQAFQELKQNSQAPVRFFVGIQRRRHSYKGTDLMLKALQRVKARYPELTEIIEVSSVPFNEYTRLMNGCHIILDQLYSYTPAMNALEAMSRGLVVVGGGEPENYEILQETELHPIINVLPDEEHIYRKLCQVVERRSELPRLSEQSRQYIRKHHDHIKVARQYLDFWSQSL